MLQAIFDGISDNLILVNKNMGIKLINKAAGKYYGISSSRDVVGRRCYQMAGRPGPCDDCALPTAILEKKTITFERKCLINPDKFEQVVVYPLVEKEFNTEDAIIRISDITEEIAAMAGDAGTELSKGGMKTKIMAAKTATGGGAAMAITEGSVHRPLKALAEGGQRALTQRALVVGGGVTGMPGHNAAREILRDLRWVRKGS